MIKEFVVAKWTKWKVVQENVEVDSRGNQNYFYKTSKWIWNKETPFNAIINTNWWILYVDEDIMRWWWEYVEELLSKGEIREE